MAIQTLSQLTAGLLPPEPLHKASFTGEASGGLHSAYYLAGVPGAATAPSGGLNGTARSANVSGQIPFPAAVAGKSVYLAGLDGVTSGIGGVWVCDRLWDNSGYTMTTTTEEAITSPAWPARDLDGSVNGRGVELALEVSADTGNGGAITNTTLNYTNSAGTAGKTGTITSFPATALAGTFVPVLLAAGDVGVRSVQGLTKGTSYVSGTMHLVAYRRVAFIPFNADNRGNRLDALTAGMPKMYDGSVPFLLYIVQTTAAGRFSGQLQWAQG